MAETNITVKGKLNSFKFIGSYNNTTGEYTTDITEITDDLEDFVFWLYADGICYVETDQKFDYDAESGSFYLIREV